MNRFELKRQIYPLFAILAFIAILPIGMIFSSSSWMWLFVLAFWLMFLCYGYWKLCLYCFCGMSFLIIMVAGVTFWITRDWKQTEYAALRCASISVAAIPLGGMSYTQLGKNMDTLRMPRFLSLITMVLFSFLPVLFTERQRIIKAFKVRGGNPHIPFIFFRSMIVPFLVRTISISDTLALSVETRGFDLRSKPKEIYEPVVPHLRDWMFMLCLLIICGTMIGVGVWLNTL